MNDESLIAKSLQLQSKSQKLLGKSQELREHSQVLFKDSNNLTKKKYPYAIKPLPTSTVNRALALMNLHRMKVFRLHREDD